MVLLYDGYALGASVRFAVETKDQETLGVEARVGSVRLNPFLGVLTAHDVRIENPPGYREKYLLTVDKMHLDVNMPPLLSSSGKQLEVSVLHAKGIRLVYEQKLTSSNVQDLQNRIKARKGQGQLAHTNTTRGGSWRPRFGPPARVILHEVDVSDIRLAMKASAFGYSTGTTVRIADIGYAHFSTEEGVFTGEAVAQALIGDVLRDTVTHYFR